MSDFEHALSVLKSAFGPDAEFREGQWESICPMLDGGSRMLVVQRTGWGKSVVYFLATKLLRDRGQGPTLLVSPLLALMRNQIELARRFGVRAANIDSTNSESWNELAGSFQNGEIDLLLVSPERLGNPEFERDVLPSFLSNPGLLVVDEAHCISDWGHDFRPDYRRIIHLIDRLPSTTPVLATTATANDRVIGDIKEQLGERLEVVRGSLVRESLYLSVLSLPDQAVRLAWLSRMLPKFPGSGIVYTLTVNDARRVAGWLRSQGIEAEAYHSDLSTEEKIELELRFQSNEIKALVATTALGMGYDKSDVAFVIHFQRPGSIISYYQQVGRAGRSLSRAWVLLLEGSEDEEINEYFIRSAFPDVECFLDVIESLKVKPKKLDQLVPYTNRRRAQVERALQHMLVEGVIQKDKEGFLLSKPDWQPSKLRAESIIAQRFAEWEQMKAYGHTPDCRMLFLAHALDDKASAPCGKCDRCEPKDFKLPEPEMVAEAQEFLKKGHFVIEPKSFYPPGTHAEGRKKIPPEERIESGLALSVYGDSGWGGFVKRGKYADNRLPDELIAPAVQLIRKLESAPEWLTWVPSLSHPKLMRDFANRLAAELGIPAIESVQKTRSHQQKDMENSTTQYRNASESYEVFAAMPGRCLLLDDIVDSGWTLTAIGTMLRRSGSGPVVPFALASARPRSEA